MAIYVIAASLIMLYSASCLSIYRPSAASRFFVMPSASSLERVGPESMIPEPPPFPPTLRSRADDYQTSEEDEEDQERPLRVMYADDFETIDDDSRSGLKTQRPEIYEDVMYAEVMNCPLISESMKDRSLHQTDYRSLFVTHPSECLTLCSQDTRCKSINTWSMEDDENKFFCQMNELDRSDDPYLLIERKGATYTDQIKCDNNEKPLTQLPDVAEVATTETSATTNTLRSILIEKFRNEKHRNADGSNTSPKDLQAKLNRLSFLEKVLKLFHQN